MTSERKVIANRANARSSTGPKTRRGRARSATNALRHGLSLPIRVDQVLYEEARALANRIAGRNASAYINMIALRVAEAEIDLRRVRAARQGFLSQRLSDSDYQAPAKVRVGVINSPRQVKRLESSAAVATEMTPPPLGAPEKLAAIVLQETESLLRMDRYERRARSRRKSAIRDFDEARRFLG